MLNTKRAGFTLVEIMIVVAIIALLAAIAVPNFLRARKRSQATLILEELRTIDAAIDQYAIDNNKSTGDHVFFDDIKVYLKAGSKVYNSQSRDLLGNYYWGDPAISQKGYFAVDGSPNCVVSMATFNSLSDVAPSDFWSPYYSPDAPSE